MRRVQEDLYFIDQEGPSDGRTRPAAFASSDALLDTIGLRPRRNEMIHIVERQDCYGYRN